MGERFCFSETIMNDRLSFPNSWGADRHRAWKQGTWRNYAMFCVSLQRYDPVENSIARVDEASERFINRSISTVAFTALIWNLYRCFFPQFKRDTQI